MSDYSAKPSGSLALLNNYSDDSDQNDEDEPFIASKPIQSAPLKVDEIAVAEASPAEIDVKASCSPSPAPVAAPVASSSSRGICLSESSSDESDNEDDIKKRSPTPKEEDETSSSMPDEVKTSSPNPEEEDVTSSPMPAEVKTSSPTPEEEIGPSSPKHEEEDEIVSPMTEKEAVPSSPKFEKHIKVPSPKPEEEDETSSPMPEAEVEPSSSKPEEGIKFLSPKTTDDIRSPSPMHEDDETSSPIFEVEDAKKVETPPSKDDDEATEEASIETEVKLQNLDDLEEMEQPEEKPQSPLQSPHRDKLEAPILSDVADSSTVHEMEVDTPEEQLMEPEEREDSSVENPQTPRTPENLETSSLKSDSPVESPQAPEIEENFAASPLESPQAPETEEKLEVIPVKSRESSEKPEASEVEKSESPHQRRSLSPSPGPVKTPENLRSPERSVDTPVPTESPENQGSLVESPVEEPKCSQGQRSPSTSPIKEAESTSSPGCSASPDKTPVSSPVVAAAMSPKVESPTKEDSIVSFNEEKMEIDEPSVSKEKVVKKQDSSDSDSSDSDEDEKMDTTEKQEEDDDAGTSNVASRQPSKESSPATNPWESPRQKPIDGVVQPRTEPPPGKPTRHTNCLEYVLTTVLKDAMKHKHSWPFQSPVDANKLDIPEYHNVIKKPMDLRTIEKRIRNIYYWSAADAIADINQLFANCYSFNPPEYDVYKMAKTLEKQIMSQLDGLPRSDLNTMIANCKTFNDRNDDIYIMCENIEGLVQRDMEYMPMEEKPQDLPEQQRRTMFSVTTPNGKTKTPKQRGRKSTRGRKKGSVGRPPSTFKEESVDDQDESFSKVDSLHFDEEEETITEKEESRAASLQPEVVEESKPSPVPPPAKKRKLENGDNGVVVKASTPVPPPVVTPVQPPTLRKNPNSMIDWKSLPPRWQGKQAEWQKFCSRLLNEIHSVKNKGFAQVFYLPVDPIKLKIFDYLDIIKVPMDLQTIKKKLDHKQYAEPEEFVTDMNLMINNCCTYNPKGSAVHQNALDLKALFDERWKLFPRPGVDPIVSDSYIHQNLVVNTDLIEDERINSYLSAVKAEEKKCAEKLEQLRSMSEGLYTIAMQRREAKLAGNIAPALANNQLNQLEKLGISIKSTPVMIPELISPALSVRSSTRAPVPKIIDDIGPSPIKARKLSKPRVSVASVASNVSVPYTPSGNPRGRKPKSGRPKKRLYSPANDSPQEVAPVKNPPFNDAPYVSVYGRKKVGVNGKKELSLKMAALQQDFVNPVLRIIQIGQYKAGQPVASLRALCDEEIDFNDATDEMIVELLDYLEMVEIDKPRARTVKKQMETKAKYYGLHLFDDDSGMIANHRIKPAQSQERVRSDSPSPSASRSGNRSSDSDSDSEDSSDSDSDAQPTRNTNVAPQRRRAAIEISASSSRASTPAGPSSRPGKGGSKGAYVKRTLSESSSSSDSNGSSSDSSDSDSEPAPKSVPSSKVSEQPKSQLLLKVKTPPSVKEASPPITKPSEPAKTKVSKPSEKKAAKAQKKPLSILDELLPNTSEKKPAAATASSSSSNSWKNSNKHQSHHRHESKSNAMSNEDLKVQQEHQNAEALRLQTEARLRRARERSTSPQNLNPEEVLDLLESNYGSFES